MRVRVVVADTGPLNYLVQIDAIGLLPKLFGRIIVPPAVGRRISAGPPIKTEFCAPQRRCHIPIGSIRPLRIGARVR